MLFISEIQLDYHNISDVCVLVHNRQELVYSVEPVGIPAAERTSFWLVKHRIDRNWFYIQVVESFTNFDESLHLLCGSRSNDQLSDWNGIDTELRKTLNHAYTPLSARIWATVERQNIVSCWNLN